MPEKLKKPKFEFSQKLLKNILEIERAYGKLESVLIPRSLLLNLQKKNLVQSSYSSTSIEGNPLSQNYVTNLLLNDRVPANRDEKEVRNYFDILTDLPGYKKEQLTRRLILDIHRRLLTGVDTRIAGEIRNHKVVVGSYAIEANNTRQLLIRHDPPFHTKKSIGESLDSLCDWISVSKDSGILKAGLFHHQFVFLHPFEDGNGRVCRIITALIMVQNGYMINKHFVLDDYYDLDRVAYSEKLHSADYADETEWLEYFTDGVKYSMVSALSRIEEGLKTLSPKQRPTNRESEILEFFKRNRELTSQDITRKFKITRQQVNNLLTSLVEKGFVEKVGETKGSYYVLI